MPVDDLLPYPLAGADSGPGQGGATGNADPQQRSTRWPRFVAAVLALVLLGSSLWLLGLWRTERQRAGHLQTELDQLRTSAAQSQAAARDAVAEPLTVEQAFGPEMSVASVAVGRFLDEVARSPAAARTTVFIAAFFGVEKTTTSWTRLDGRRGVSGVLGSLDDPVAPELVWVSRRSAETVDPSIPSRKYCLQLDIERIVASAASQREWGAGADTAPLRWWSDVYAFVPADQCGR